MVGAGWLNLGSILLGLIAWILPVINLMQRNRGNPETMVVLSVASVSACSLSLCLQIFYTSHLVQKEDWSALMDISPTVVVVASILLAGTLILNVIAMVVYSRKPLKD